MIRKLIADKKMIDVVTDEEYRRAHSSYDSNTSSGIIRDGYVYPIRKNTDDRFGAYPGFPDDVVGFYRGEPNEEYNVENVIDFNNIHTVHDLINTQAQLSSAENALLSEADEIFEPPLLQEDTPEMRALKEAVIAKHMDISKYEHRFGARYNNDKRLFKKADITLSKLRSTCTALDIKATLILQDSAPDVANPIGKIIEVDITSPENIMREEDDE